MIDDASVAFGADLSGTFSLRRPRESYLERARARDIRRAYDLAVAVALRVDDDQTVGHNLAMEIATALDLHLSAARPRSPGLDVARVQRDENYEYLRRLVVAREIAPVLTQSADLDGATIRARELLVVLSRARFECRNLAVVLDDRRTFKVAGDYVAFLEERLAENIRRLERLEVLLAAVAESARLADARAEATDPAPAWVAVKAVGLVCRLLPRGDHARYAEEFRAELDEISGSATTWAQVTYALRLGSRVFALRAALRTRRSRWNRGA